MTIKKKDLNLLEEIAENESTKLTALGEVGGKRLKIDDWIDLSVDELKSIYYSSLGKMMEEAI